MSKPTIIFVHGAFHTPESFGPLAALLRAASHPCIEDLKLPGTGNTSTATLADDASALRKVVLRVLDDEGQNCIVVMFSYGAVVGIQGLQGLGRKARGAEGKTTGVLKMVYLSANIPREGESHFGQVGAWMAENGREMPPIVDIRDGVGFFVGDESVFYNDLGAEMQRELMGKLEGQSMRFVVLPFPFVLLAHLASWMAVVMSGRKLTVSMHAADAYLESCV
jgi:pimeloyl-ACP methyl ester carboxylesterase